MKESVFAAAALVPGLLLWWLIGKPHTLLDTGRLRTRRIVLLVWVVVSIVALVAMRLLFDVGPAWAPGFVMFTVVLWYGYPRIRVWLQTTVLPGRRHSVDTLLLVVQLGLTRQYRGSTVFRIDTDADGMVKYRITVDGLEQKLVGYLTSKEWAQLYEGAIGLQSDHIMVKAHKANIPAEVATRVNLRATQRGEVVAEVSREV